MERSKQLMEAIAVTAELTGTNLSEIAARVMTQDLMQYPVEQVLGALVKCRRELKGNLRIAEIIDRLDDGRPGANEAWAMIPKTESASVVWTDEMTEAYGVALPLIEDGDHVAARMAFIETYKSKCADARNNGIPVKWEPSLGHDKNGREHVLLAAVEKGLLAADHVAKLLPYHEQSAFADKLLGVKKGDGKMISIGEIVSKIAEEEKQVEPV